MTPASSSKTTLVVSSEAGPGRARTCEPITVGIPMPRGLVTEPRQIALVDGDGKPVPLQALPTERWPDGSVRWALLDFQANGPVAADSRYRADLPWRHDGIACAAPAGHGNRRTSRHRHRRGAIRLQPGMAFPFSAVTAGGKAPVDATERRVRRHRPARPIVARTNHEGRSRGSRRAAVERAAGRVRRPPSPAASAAHCPRARLCRIGGGARVDHAPKPAPRAAPRRLLGAGRSRIGLHQGRLAPHRPAVGHLVGRVRAGTGPDATALRPAVRAGARIRAAASSGGIART